MAETHHVSYVGGAAALAALLDDLESAGLVDAEVRAFVRGQQQSDPAQEEPIYIPATGEEGTTTQTLADILDAFNTLHDGSGRALDAGQLPNTHTVDYIGDPQGERLLIDLFTEHGLSIEDVSEQDEWPPPATRIAERPGDVATTFIVYGWNDMAHQVTAIIEQFRLVHQGHVKDLGPS